MRTIINRLAGFVFLLFVFSFTHVYGQENTTLSYPEFIKKVKETNGQLIDIRTPQEHASGHLPDSRLINFLAPDFAENISKLDKDDHYFLYCRSGNRSNKALKQMEDMGFKNVYHLHGGVIGMEARQALVK